MNYTFKRNQIDSVRIAINLSNSASKLTIEIAREQEYIDIDVFQIFMRNRGINEQRTVNALCKVMGVE